MNQISSHFKRLGEARPRADHVPLGQLLLDGGDLAVGDLLPALSEHKSLGVQLGQVVVAKGLISETRLYDLLANQWGLSRFRADQYLDPQLAKSIGLANCLRQHVVPIEIKNGVLLLAVSSKEAFEIAEQALEETYGLVTLIIASPKEIEEVLVRIFPSELADLAASDVPFELSCRGLADFPMRRALWGIGALSFFTGLFFIFPSHVTVAFTLFAVFLSLSSAAMKIAALITELALRPQAAPSDPVPKVYPKISVMVPLHREPNVASILVKRLERLTYPKPLLEIILVIEENDEITKMAIEATQLPAWITPVLVPEGNPKTKPRALNHAFKFCSGDIIGIYDAEDCPDADQLENVVAQFEAAKEDVACLQGILQFYNPTQNWLARCFTMDYAAWFRVILPGLSKLGMPVPLGGTSLFLKRQAIEAMHGWDAHNVTEDADLGIRLNRAGYRTEIISSVTGEEANCYPWRWIRQRSRWIKGYMVTYWAHMRNPLALRRDLGTKAFIGFQVIFLGTILYFLTAPILWSFLLTFVGIIHPFFAFVPEGLATATALCFLGVELLGMTIFAIANHRADRNFLTPWIPTMSIYYLLIIPAGLKALWEFFRAPVFWDKTDHGHSIEEN